MLNQGPRHAHSEGKTGPRHGTHEKLQIGFEAFLGIRALAQLAGPRLSTRETQNFTQKLNFCTIKLPQIKSHKPKTTTNISNILKPIKNTNPITQNTSKQQEQRIPNSTPKNPKNFYEINIKKSIPTQEKELPQWLKLRITFKIRIPIKNYLQFSEIAKPTKFLLITEQEINPNITRDHLED